MTYWTWRRYAALVVHILLALGLMAWSLSSSLHFWSWAFTDEVYAYGAVIFIDMLALLGFVLYIARVQTPLAHARHVLPVVSAGPLAFDMHRQFGHLHEGLLVWSFTLGITGLLVGLAFVVWRSIERLFVDPVAAAREYAEQKMQALVTVSEQLQVMQGVADGFVQGHRSRAEAALLASSQAALPVQTYARPAEPAVQQVGTTRLHDAPALVRPDASTMHEDASLVDDASADMHDASAPMHADASLVDADALPGDFTYSVTHYRCMKCNAVNETPAGSDSSKQRGASKRWGCPQCKERTNAPAA